MMRDRVFGSTAATSSGISRMFALWKFWAYSSTLSLWWTSGDFFLVAQDSSVADLSGGFCPGGIELAESEVSFVLLKSVAMAIPMTWRIWLPALRLHRESLQVVVKEVLL